VLLRQSQQLAEVMKTKMVMLALAVLVSSLFSVVRFLLSDDEFVAS